MLGEPAPPPSALPMPGHSAFKPVNQQTGQPILLPGQLQQQLSKSSDLCSKSGNTPVAQSFDLSLLMGTQQQQQQKQFTQEKSIPISSLLPQQPQPPPVDLKAMSSSDPSGLQPTDASNGGAKPSKPRMAACFGGGPK